MKADGWKYRLITLDHICQPSPGKQSKSRFASVETKTSHGLFLFRNFTLSQFIVRVVLVDGCFMRVTSRCQNFIETQFYEIDIIYIYFKFNIASFFLFPLLEAWIPVWIIITDASLIHRCLKDELDNMFVLCDPLLHVWGCVMCAGQKTTEVVSTPPPSPAQQSGSVTTLTVAVRPYTGTVSTSRSFLGLYLVLLLHSSSIWMSTWTWMVGFSG